MLFGVSYYHEYQPYDRLAEDVAMMRDAGIDYARVGDSVWALCEPSEGRFETEWLRPVLDALHEGGIEVVLTTPTYAIPAWLARRHPEVLARATDGRRASFGGRQNVNIAHPAYRFHAERVIRALLSEYARHPAVIGFQVDNETGSGFVDNDDVFDSFVSRLKERFGSVDRLNEIWGLNYWSHRLGDWSDLWRPAPRVPIGCGMSGNTNPGYDLEWRRFQATLVNGFLRWQKGIVREYAREDQFVIQDMVGGHGRSDVDRHQVSQIVDVVAENFPHASQDALAHPAPEHTVAFPGDRAGTGAVQLYQRADMARSGRQENFFIPEMNPISVGGADNTFPGYDGQWRMAAYATISRGAEMVAYWHWHSLHYGAETYSHGILNHDLGPNRCYNEIARVGAELKEHGELLTGLRPEAEAALLYSQDSRYAFEFQPCLKTPQGAPDHGCYQRVFDTFYRGLFDARAQTAVVHPPQDFDGFPVLVAPMLYVADDALLERLTAYAEGGGHLVLTFRSGYGDEHGRARWADRAPGPLRKAAGLSYGLYSNLATPLPVSAADGAGQPYGGLSLPAGVQAHAWADELELEGAQPLAYYDHPHFGRYPAVTTRQFGAGRVTYVGTLPDAAFSRALADWVLRASGVAPLGEGLPESVRVTRARARDGRRLWFLSNWSFDTHRLADPPVAGRDLFDGRQATAGTGLELGPWDSTVIIED
ncbi:beta-galactosidase [Streptomyces armeniacus]|uniref:Beta-galactosidase n=1 Tax=Streptomyces armeniacus TaxID=83291 RepID=A0A345XJ04_9ACTN|nr:beta-galactosidase [Streptomyces armeniacus]AXK31620.1 beta-galactosidase [Streptomyces armeniacus]